MKDLLKMAERLAEEAQECREAGKEKGLQDGIKWAVEAAGKAQLQKLADRTLFSDPQQLQGMLTEEWCDADYFEKLLEGCIDPDAYMEGYAEGFIEGALNAWRECQQQ